MQVARLNPKLQNTGTSSAVPPVPTTPHPVCVIAQQYSSDTFLSLRFTHRQEISGAHLIKLLFGFPSLLFKIA
jgi:hypothetical protein